MGKMDHDYRFNIVLVGDNQCGKSFLLGRYGDGMVVVENGIQLWHGIEIKKKIIQLKNQSTNEMVKVELMIFDGNGGYKFKELFYENYLKSQHGFIIMYDVTNLESFNNLSNWISKIKNSYQTSNLYPSPEPILFIVGNKCDLIDDSKINIVDSKKAQEFCESLSIPSIHNVSVKENINVDIIFQKLSQLIMDTYPPPKISEIKKIKNNVNSSGGGSGGGDSINNCIII
ncbi:hypothetical protein ACTFIZ_006406 [Dictyostelium cf. discoideum]